jgi:hypothetical protein
MRNAVRAILCLLATVPFIARSQVHADSATAPGAIPNKLSQQYIGSVDKKSEQISADINKQTDKYLSQLQKQEAKIQRKLFKVDSVAAKSIFPQSQQAYQQIQDEIRNKSQNILKGSGQYIPWVDTAITSLKFLGQAKAINGQIGSQFSLVQGAMGKVKALEAQFNQAENVKGFIRQRKEYLKQQLANYNLGTELSKYNSTAGYYGQQIDEYRKAWNDPSKLEAKVMKLLNGLPVWQDFVKKNSMLAGLFNIPDDYGNMASIAGLQTRDQVQQLISSRTMLMGANGAQQAKQNVIDAESTLTSMRDKIQQQLQQGGGSGTMPDFTPNTQKTKKLLSRLEYGLSGQSATSSTYFPANTQFAMTVAYRLSDKNSIGLGASYKLGWGQPIKNIRISSQGIGLRSFLDIKIKGSWYASGGFEYNYTPLPAISATWGGDAWQKSGLIGVSKVLPIKSGMFKETKIQLLWDFISYYQLPKTPALQFRWGYNF